MSLLPPTLPQLLPSSHSSSNSSIELLYGPSPLVVLADANDGKMSDTESSDDEQIQLMFSHPNSSTSTIIDRARTPTLGDSIGPFSALSVPSAGVPSGSFFSQANTSVSTLTGTLSETFSSEDESLVTAESEEDSQPPLRKLKSSLKLHRTQSLPLSSPSKNVRFATELTHVKRFQIGSKPSSISNENSPEFFAAEDDDEVDYFSLVRGSGRQAKPNFFSLLADDSSDSEDDDLLQSKWTLTRSNVVPGPLTAQVKLESIELQHGYKIRGYINVANLTFEKFIEVKFTLDGWKSINYVTASYDKQVSAEVDRFTFVIDIPVYLRIATATATVVKIELCCRYDVSGQTYYDNNNYSNYQLTLEKQRDEVVKPVKLSKGRQFNDTTTHSSQFDFMGRPRQADDQFYKNLVKSYCFYGAPKEVKDRKKAPLKVVHSTSALPALADKAYTYANTGFY